MGMRVGGAACRVSVARLVGGLGLLRWLSPLVSEKASLGLDVLGSSGKESKNKIKDELTPPPTWIHTHRRQHKPQSELLHEGRMFVFIGGH